MLHITDISWKRINHPSEILRVGDEMDVVVLKYDQEKNRVSLGMKQLDDDPWDKIPEKLEGKRGKSPGNLAKSHEKLTKKAEKVTEKAGK